MKKIILFLISFLLCINILAQTSITAGMTGLQMRTALNGNENRTNLRFDTLRRKTTGYVTKYGKNAAPNLIDLYANTLAIGASALNLNIAGYDNLALGNQALEKSTGHGNLSVGFCSMQNATTANDNLMIGYMAGQNMDISNSNIGVGHYTQRTGAHIGSCNNSFGSYTLYYNQAYDNNAFGSSALYNNTIGFANSAYGTDGLYNNVDGHNNTAFGVDALYTNISGINNTAAGDGSGYFSRGSNNLFLGYFAGAYETTASNMLFIDTWDRLNITDGKLKSLIYGIFANNPSDQRLTINGRLIVNQINAALTDGAPTDAEIDAATGLTPATATVGFKVTIKDTSGSGLLYQIETDGTDWFYTIMTKAL